MLLCYSVTTLANKERKMLFDISFYLKTWSGRIIIINSIVFILMTIAGGDILMPPEEVLLRFGAKDPVDLVRGEWWRYITPIFVHIGLIHFAFNNLALAYIGSQLEKLTSPAWFLSIYFVSGISGNIASAIYHPNIGAGASGAIFGLIGAGFLFEKLILSSIPNPPKRTPLGSYAGLIVINLAFGFLVPGIDNTAHMGGLIGGIIVAKGMLLIKPNRLTKTNPFKGVLVLVTFASLMVLGATVGMSKIFIGSKLQTKGFQAFNNFSTSTTRDDKKKYALESFYYYSRDLEIDPYNQDALFARGSLLILSGNLSEGLQDLTIPAANPKYKEPILKLAKELKAMGMKEAADALKDMVKDSL